jgi:hypothetical protein
MVEIRAAETKRATVAGKNDHGVTAEILPAVVAARLAVRNEDTVSLTNAMNRAGGWPR